MLPPDLTVWGGAACRPDKSSPPGYARRDVLKRDGSHHFWRQSRDRGLGPGREPPAAKPGPDCRWVQAGGPEYDRCYTGCGSEGLYASSSRRSSSDHKSRLDRFAEGSWPAADYETPPRREDAPLLSRSLFQSMRPT